MKFIPLKELVTINQGLQIPIEQRLLVEIPDSYFYITNEFLKANGKKYFIKNPLKSVMCNKNDILMTRTGNTGKVVTNINGCFHNNFFKINYDERLNKEYLYQFLCSPFVQRKIEKLAGVSTIPDLNHNDFYCICIPYIDVETQGKFGLLLSSIDQLIEEKNELINLYLDETKFFINDTYKKLNYPELTLENLGLEIYDGNYGEKYPTEKNLSSKGEIPFLRVNNLKDYKICYDNCKFIPSCLHDDLRNGHTLTDDILITVRGEVGKLGYVNEENANNNINAQIAILRNTILYPKYLLFYLRAVNNKIIQLETGSALKQLSKKDIYKICAMVPPIDKQVEIGNLLSSMDNLIELHKQELEELKQIKKYYLNKIFSGE